MKPTLCGLL